MSIVDAIERIEDLDDLHVLEDSLSGLINSKRDELVRSYCNRNERVGFVYNARMGKGKRTRTKKINCTAVIIEFSSKNAIVEIISPPNMADERAKVPKVWLVGPFVKRESAPALNMPFGDAPSELPPTQ